MTATSFNRSLQKDKMVKVEKCQIDADERNDEPINGDNETGSPKESQVCYTAFVYLCIFLGIFVVIQLCYFPEPIPNPYPTRSVHLHKTNGGYGFVLDGVIIKDVTIGGAAHIHGEIKHGDKIVAINGIDVDNGHNQNGIPELLEMKDGEVKLVVVVNYKASFWDKFLFFLPKSFTGSILGTFMAALVMWSKHLDEEENREQAMCGREVTLTTVNGCYGLRMDDGTPKRVKQVTPGGPADLQGNIRAGDLIMSINGVTILKLSSEIISQLFKTRDGEVKLIVTSKSDLQ